MGIKYTPTEQRIIDLLSDGLMHSSNELLGCLEGADELSKSAVRQHIFNMRRKMAEAAEYISCEVYSGRLYWRHVRLIVTPENGPPTTPAIISPSPRKAREGLTDNR